MAHSGGELRAIEAADRPETKASLVDDLTQLGVEPDSTVIVHTSLSALGWVAGGAQAVVEALLETVGVGGTIVMPAHSTQLSDPLDWQNPPLPQNWIDTTRAALPAFDPRITSTRGMGQVAECFRCHPGARRSSHPLLSFVAVGPNAIRIVENHPLSGAFGESSPLGRLYELGARILLLGVGHESNTSLHLAEHRANWPAKRYIPQGALVTRIGRRVWVEYEELDYNEEDFTELGEIFAAAGGERTSKIGAGIGRLLQMRDMVDFGVRWMTEHRNRP